MNVIFYSLFFVFLILLTIVIASLVSFKLFKSEYSRAINPDITLDDMKTIERRISNFYSDNDLDSDSNILQVARKLNITKTNDSENIQNQAEISSPDKDGNMTVTFKAGLDSHTRNFAFAHECAHLINQDPLPNSRKDEHNKPALEQLADYAAAALLMPINSVLKELTTVDYKMLSNRKKLKFIRSLCKRYNVDEIIVLRRIGEIYRLQDDCNLIAT